MTRVSSWAHSGIVERCPVLKQEIEAVFGQSIDDSAWCSVELAYANWGRRRDDLNSSCATRKKDDPRGWAARKRTVERDLQAALDSIAKSREHGDFLHEVTAHYRLQFGPGSVRSARLHLDDAYMAVLHAITIVERAEPIEREIPSETQSRRILARDLQRALCDGGLECRLSDGRSLPEDASESELTPFEQLIGLLGVHEAETPAARSRWIRRAMGQD